MQMLFSALTIIYLFFRQFDLYSMKSTCVINNINDDCIPFRCSGVCVCVGGVSCVNKLITPVLFLP